MRFHDLKWFLIYFVVHKSISFSKVLTQSLLHICKKYRLYSTFSFYILVSIILTFYFCPTYLLSQNKQNTIENILNPDGTIKKGTVGSYNSLGYHLINKQSESPKFIKSENNINKIMDGALNGPVYAIAINGNDVYVGGEFTQAGGINTLFIAKWNGTNWSALGSGVNNTVYTIAVDGNDVYVGGKFTSAGGISVNYIAKWNGSSWSDLGNGLGGYVKAIAIEGSNIYVGGWFDQAGGKQMTGIAKWNGNSWLALGSGINNYVLSIAISNGDLYVGGWFSRAGGNPASYIARWDGTNWSALGSGVNSDVNAIAISGNDIYVGGNFILAGETPVSRIAKWNGSTWSALGSGVNSTVTAIAISGNDVYVSGHFSSAGETNSNGIAKWGSGNWSSLSSTSGCSILTMTMSGSDIYVSIFCPPYIQKWNGTLWSDIGSISIPTISSTTSSNILVTSATLGANVTSNGGSEITERGIIWSTSANPTTTTYLGKTTSTGTIGSFSVTASNLLPATLYHYRGYATNVQGTAYTSDATFTTLSIPPPTISSPMVSNITVNSAILGANVTSDNGYTITERGIVYSTNSNPTTADNKITATGTTGLFTVDLSGLSSNTLYHFRGYAINAGGTAYTSDAAFNTISLFPTISLDKNSLNYGDITVGSNNDQTIIISNTGTAQLNITGLSIIGNDNSMFTIISGGTTPINIIPGGNTPIKVRFAPTTSGLKSASLQITHNASGSPSTASLAGNGIDKPLVTTGAANSITSNSVIFNGTVNPNSVSTNVWFEWALDQNLTSSTSTQIQTIEAGTSVLQVVSNLSNLNPNTKYYYRISAQNIVGLVKGIIMSFTTKIASPDIPNLVSPTNNSTNISLNPKLIWNNANKAEYYQIQVSNASSFSTTIKDTSGVKDTTIQLKEILNNTKYYWRVRAINDGGTSDWSSIWNFSTIPTYNITGMITSDGKSLDGVTVQISGNSVGTIITDPAGSYSFTISSGRNYSIIPSKKNYIFYPASQSFINVQSDLIQNFTATLTNLSAPILQLPPNNSNSIIIEPILIWNSVTEAKSYLLQVSEDSTFNSMIINDSSITDISKKIGLLQSYTKYFWRVLAKSGNKSSDWSDIWYFTTAIVPPGTPLLIFPINKSNTLPSVVKFIWSRSLNTRSYCLQISKDQNFNAPFVINDTTITDTSKFINGLEKYVTYYWRIRALNQGLQSSWTSTRNFSISNTPPSSFSLIKPSTNDFVLLTYPPKLVTFLWRKSNDLDIMDTVKYSITISIKNYIVLKSEIIDTIVSLDIMTLLKPYEKYNWYITASDGKDYTNSDTLSFTTSTNVTNIDRNNYNVSQNYILSQNYPNPFNPETRIEYTIPENTFVNLKIFDTYGREVENLVSRNQTTGAYSVAWQPKDLPSGVYFYKIQAGVYSEMKKMLYLR